MKESLLFSLLKSEKNIICQRILLELIHSLLVVFVAWQTAGIVNDVFLNARNFKETAPAIMVLFLVLLTMAILRYFRSNIDYLLSDKLRRYIRRKLHLSLLIAPTTHLSPNEIAKNTLTLAIEKTDALDNYFKTVLPTIITFITLTPAILCATTYFDIISAILFIVTLPIAPFLLYLIGRLTKKANLDRWHELSNLERNFAEIIKGTLTLKIYGKTSTAGDILAKNSNDFSKVSLSVLKIAFISSFALELITTLAIALVAVTIGLRLLTGDIDFVVAFFILILAPQLYQPLREGGIAFHEAIEAKTAEDELKPHLASPKIEIPLSHEKILIPPAICLKDISYRYPQASHEVISKLNAVLPANKISVITGESGSGKSTLLQLIAGIIEPSTGDILLGNINSYDDLANLNAFRLSKLSQESKNKLISYVPQEPHIFTASLADNITMFSNHSEQAIFDAIKQAKLEEFLFNLPQGLKTPLGDGGHPLSLGERHRLGLARAILESRPLIILDEPTAGLNEELEQDIIKTIIELNYYRTIVIASHRPAVIKLAAMELKVSPAEEYHAS